MTSLIVKILLQGMKEPCWGARVQVGCYNLEIVAESSDEKLWIEKHLFPIEFLKYQTGLNLRCCLLESG